MEQRKEQSLLYLKCSVVVDSGVGGGGGGGTKKNQSWPGAVQFKICSE